MNNIALIIASVAASLQVPPGLVSAVAFVESSHRINAVNRNDGHGHSIGVMQIKLKTARHLGFRGTEKELQNPEVNIYYGVKYLKYQHQRYGNSWRKATAAYNSGTLRLDEKKKIKNQGYVTKVFAAWAEGR